jgi:hypothetical protein
MLVGGGLGGFSLASLFGGGSKDNKDTSEPPQASVNTQDAQTSKTENGKTYIAEFSVDTSDFKTETGPVGIVFKSDTWDVYHVNSPPSTFSSTNDTIGVTITHYKRSKPNIATAVLLTVPTLISMGKPEGDITSSETKTMTIAQWAGLTGRTINKKWVGTDGN